MWFFFVLVVIYLSKAVFWRIWPLDDEEERKKNKGGRKNNGIIIRNGKKY